MFDKLSIKLFDRDTAFEVLREDWKRLFAAAEAAPFASWEWTATWFEFFGENGLPFILAAYSGSVLVALLPLYCKQQKVLGMPFKKLAFMNSEIGGAAYLDVLALPDEKKAATDAFLEFLEQRGEIGLLELESVAADSVLLEEIRRHKDQSEFRLRVVPHDVCQYAEVGGATDEFLKRIFNDTAKKKLKRIKKLPGFEFRRTTENIEPAFQRFIELHDGNWAGKGGSEVSGHRRLLDFHLAAAIANAKRGAIFFDELWIENECVASLYGFQAENKYFYYSSGYDERLSKLSPMVTLYNLSIEKGLADDVRTFDFLCGGQSYKEHWTNGRNELVTVSLRRRNLPALVHETASRATRGLRDFSKFALSPTVLEKLKSVRRGWKRKSLSTGAPSIKIGENKITSDVSIVIIGRNEESGIAKCLQAAQAAAEQIGGAEIIYVDSASTDATVEIAASVVARVVALDARQTLCPSAGRSAGSLAATGEFILFLDADTLIYKDFLPAAIEHLLANPGLAGVNGRIDDTDESGVLLSDVEERFESIAETKWLRGPACFYRRAALAAVGSFNPQIIVEEEAELGLRLLRNGWRINLLPIPMALHTRCHHHQTFKSIFTTFRRDYAIGRHGEVVKTIACAFRQGFGWKFCWLRLKTTLIFTVWLLPLLLAVFFYITSLPILAAICAAFAAGGFFAVWLKKRSFYQALLFFPAKFLCLVDVLAGISKIGFKKSEHFPRVENFQD